MFELLDELPPALQWPVYFMAGVTAVCYVVSEITGNVSQVDRLWAILPLVYVAYFALFPLWPTYSFLGILPYLPEDTPAELSADYSSRALLMLALTLVWSVRLNYNSYRRGFFNFHEEDYRWPILRKKLPKWFFHLLNLTFIAIMQNLILFAVALPVYEAAKQPHTPLETSDYVLFIAGLVTNMIEFTADNQHQSFHKYKVTGKIDKNEWIGINIKWTPEDAKRGFITRGLWAWSRHPNFVCEQLCWIVINLFPIAASSYPKFDKNSFGLSALWDIVPAFVYCSVFLGSTPLTESITSGKYPGYNAYQKRVSMFVPWLTPVWGFLLQLKGEREEVDRAVYGDGKTAKQE